MVRTFNFRKNGEGEWFVDLPEWIGDPAELQMVEGADKWLELMAGTNKECAVKMSEEPFSNADVLTLFHVRDTNLSGGGDYHLDSYDGVQTDLDLWLCAVTEFVFSTLPEKIWFTRA
ncbi:MAG: hypothetical protein EOO89_13755 [Pedobacter sp.]|nr:MAG: hypothetical protein EOO89_13755 [Pedobacter sp.]